MREPGRGGPSPELKELVTEASRALALMDAERLEEIALSCEALNQDLAVENVVSATQRDLARQAEEARTDMAIFGKVLDATRANLHVMKRLHEIRLGQLEYSVQWSSANWAKAPAEERNGND